MPRDESPANVIMKDVPPGYMTGIYYIPVSGLPFGAIWQLFKDWFREAGCRVDHIEIFQRSTCGWIRLIGIRNFELALQRLQTAPYNNRLLMYLDKNRTDNLKILELLDDPPPQPRLGGRNPRNGRPRNRRRKPQQQQQQQQQGGRQSQAGPSSRGSSDTQPSAIEPPAVEGHSPTSADGVAAPQPASELPLGSPSTRNGVATQEETQAGEPPDPDDGPPLDAEQQAKDQVEEAQAMNSASAEENGSASRGEESSANQSEGESSSSRSEESATSPSKESASRDHDTTS